MRKLGINPEDVQLSGGGTKSSLWKQMLADIFNAPCSMVNAREGAAYGAALLAAVGVGQYENVASATAAWIRTTETIQPSSEVDIYGKYYSLYQGLYPKLKETFSEISTLC